MCHFCEYKKESDINGYLIDVPSVGQPISQTGSVYDEITNCIYCFGGRDKHENVLDSMYIFNLDKFEWEYNKKHMPKPKYSFGLCAVPENNIVICGGYNSGKELNSCEVYDIKKNEFKSIDKMNKNRWGMGSCWIDLYKRVIIGGGIGRINRAEYTCEIYDSEKDIWCLINKEFKHSHSMPNMSVDRENNNIIYISGNGTRFSHDTITESYIESLDLRCTNNGWTIVDDKSTRQLFGFQCDDQCFFQTHALLNL